jgi:hypothetical protein
MSQRRFLSVLAAFACAMAVTFAAMQPSLAEDDDDDGPSGLQKLFGSIGLLSLPGPQIDYQERPPLVVPPVTTYVQPQVPQNSPAAQSNPWDFNNPRQAHLPPPDSAPPAAPSLVLPQPVEPYTARTRNPDFPLDPEVKAAQKRKKNSKKVFSRAEDDPFYSGKSLTRNEMTPAGPVQRGKADPNNNPDGKATSGVQELNVPLVTNVFRNFGREKEPPVEFTGEPERQSLTQPPSGYLTPSKNAPYGVVGKDRDKDTTRLVHPNMPDYQGDHATR